MITRKQEVISAFNAVNAVTAGLESTWFGKDGWGDCGAATNHMVASTQPGAYYEQNERLFDQELIHGLRHTIALDPATLAGLPAKIDLARSEDLDINEEVQRIRVHMGAAALMKVGLITVDSGEVTVPQSTKDVAYYLRGDIRQPEDRQMHEMLGDLDIPPQLGAVGTLSAQTFEEPAEWWNFMLSTLESYSSGS